MFQTFGHNIPRRNNNRNPQHKLGVVLIVHDPPACAAGYGYAAPGGAPDSDCAEALTPAPMPWNMLRD